MISHGLWNRYLLMLYVCASVLISGGCGLGGTGLFLSDDTDRDGLSNQIELLLGTDPDNPDSDFDGLNDGDEIAAGTSPLARDSDGDGIADGEDDFIDPPSRRTGSVSTGNDLEPNDTFRNAVVLENVGSDELTFQGRIDRQDDVDLFDLGPMFAGDRLRIDLIRRDDNFRASVAIFDSEELLFNAGFDPFIAGGPDLNRFILETIRHDSPRYFLGITRVHDDIVLGAYQLNVTILRNRSIPQPKPQTILLDFDGGVLDRPILDVSVVNAFNARDIDTFYENNTDTIKQMIIRTVEENCSGLNIIIRTSDDPPTSNPVSTLLFGSFSDFALGASEGIDAYNANCCDDGVVFTESFSPDVFGFFPRARALGIAIGNVASHEIGHLLGLQHVTDTQALMDEASPVGFLLIDQDFILAPLAESIFPVGYQDAMLLLEETVGIR